MKRFLIAIALCALGLSAVIAIGLLADRVAEYVVHLRSK